MVFSAEISFENGSLPMKNALRDSLGQQANYVLWCPEDFPADVKIEWSFAH